MTDYTQTIIDVHTHLLPNADDGSRHSEETEMLIKSAHAQGVRGIIITPHYKHGHNRLPAARILEQFKTLKMKIAETVPDMTLWLGEELFYYNELTDALLEGRALTVNGTRYILVEFPVTIFYQDLFQAVRQLTQAGYIPVLAHIERYECLRREGRVEELIQTGAYMQMNYESLVPTGFRHMADVSWCRKMILEEKIHFLATDMHRADFRPPKIQKAAGWFWKKAGQEQFERLTRYNPEKLLKGESI